MATNKNQEIFTVQEYAEYKGCTRANIYQAIRNHSLKIVWKQPYVEYKGKRHYVGKPIQFVIKDN